MPQGKETKVVVSGVTFSSSGQSSPLPVGTAQPIVVTGSNLNKNAAVHGQIADTSIVFQNPA